MTKRTTLIISVIFLLFASLIPAAADDPAAGEPAKSAYLSYESESGTGADAVKCRGINGIIFKIESDVTFIRGDFFDIDIASDKISLVNEETTFTVFQTNNGGKVTTHAAFLFRLPVTMPGKYKGSITYKGVKYETPEIVIDQTEENSVPDPFFLRSARLSFNYMQINLREMLMIVSEINGFSIIFKGEYEKITTDGFEETYLVRNGEYLLSAVVYDITVDKLSFGSDKFTKFSFHFAHPVTGAGIYYIKGKYKGVPFRTDSIAILDNTQIAKLSQYVGLDYESGIVNAVLCGADLPYKNPDETLTRSEYFSMMHAYSKSLTGMSIKDFISSLDPDLLFNAVLTDTENVIIKDFARLGIITGDMEGKIYPEKLITRGESSYLYNNISMMSWRTDIYFKQYSPKVYFSGLIKGEKCEFYNPEKNNIPNPEQPLTYGEALKMFVSIESDIIIDPISLY